MVMYSLPTLPFHTVVGDVYPPNGFSSGLTPIPAITLDEKSEHAVKSDEIPMVPMESEKDILESLNPSGEGLGELPSLAWEAEASGEVEEVESTSEENASEFSDEDLAEALMPLFAGMHDKRGPDSLLEPMLRATVRRALAEYSPLNRPFRKVGFTDRLGWRLRALFSSRNFEDIVFEKTHRFQVDEVYLYDRSTFGLVSYASSDPVRHAEARRVEVSAKKVAAGIRRDEQGVCLSFQMQDGRHVVFEEGRYVSLAAVVRGYLNEMIAADLDYAVGRIELRFGERLSVPGIALMRDIQPFLEDCLLIQAPVAAGC